MLLATLGRRVRGRALQATMAPLPGILPDSEFQRLLARERSRSDRNSHPFSLVVFAVGRLPRARMRRVAEILRDRRRLTDDVGWLGLDELGVLLPDTPAKGARRFAEKILPALRKEGCDVEDRIYTYQGNSDDSSMWAPPPDPPCPVVPDPPPGTLPSRPWPAGMAVRVNDLRSLFLKPLPPWKRAMDVLVSALLLVLLSPVFLAVAVTVRLSSPGPIIFRQPRAGRGGHPFTFYKFRTMVANAEELKESLRGVNEAEGPVFKIRQDPRVTTVGRFLRRTSMDELPQLWNVLKGDMSLVGPRPPTMDEIPSYASWQARRLELTGGITGIWQTSGRHEVGFVDWMRMDVRYSNQAGFATDLKLLARTVWAVLSGRGAS